MDEIKILIRRGYLNKYKRGYRVEKPTEYEKTEEKQLVQEPNKPTSGAINVIVRGIAS